VERVEILDSLNVVFHLNHSSGGFLYSLASPFSLMISTRTVSESGNKNDTIYYGTGPFIKDNFSGPVYSIKKNKQYQGIKSELDRVYFVRLLDNENREYSLTKGEVDILSNISGHQIDRLKWLGKIDYYVQRPFDIFFLGFNNKNKEMKNIFLRKAIASAIDLKKLVFNVNRGNAVVAMGPLPEIYYNYEGSIQLEYNLNESKKYLLNSGLGKSVNLNIIIPKMALTRETLLETIKTQLSKIGISLNVIYSYNWDEHDKLVKDPKSHLFIDGARSEIIGDPEPFLYSLFSSNSVFNTMNYNSPDVDSLLLMLKKEGDANQRFILCNQIMKHIENDVPALFLYHVKSHYAYNKEKIKKMVVNPYGLIQYHKVQLN
ncbi:MAG: ABC transporter substrate-binding protein, partial [Calditrichaceae bacterium]